MCSTTMERVARPGGPPPEAGAGLTGALEWLDLAVRRLTDLGAAGVGRGGRVGGGLALHRLGPALASLDGVRLLLLGAVDADGRWAVDGSRSAVAWLARFTRSGRAAAGVEVRTARALRERLPLTAAALLYGRVTVGHARVLARLCLRTPDDDRRAG